MNNDATAGRKITLPTIHTNGTPPETLLEGYLTARAAVNDALDAIRQIEFNARDYYVVEGAWDAAKAEMRARAESLQAVADDFLAIAEHCQNDIGQREERRAWWVNNQNKE